MKLKRIMITGSYPPDICGVGDYTSCFMNAATKDTWHLYYSKEWGISKVCDRIREINDINSDCIYMQYPTMGYGWSIVPLLLCIYYSWFTKKKFVSVIHEFSQRTLKARLFTSLLIFVANKLILTSEFEKQYITKRVPFVHKKISIIRIISNIEGAIKLRQWSKRKYDIAYFGHIRPLKGLEDFFEMVSELTHKRKLIRVAVVGQLSQEFEGYFNEIKKYHIVNDIEFFFNASMSDVSDILNNSKITYLPFPDGISERRGSFLAAISNGSIVVTYSGKFITDSLREVCSIIERDESVDRIDYLLNNIDDISYLQIVEKQKYYISNILPNSWKEILNLYNSV